MKTLKIGIVGGGGMGRVHYANWKAIEDIEIVALCDNAPNAPATAEEWGVPLYTSITEMIQSSPGGREEIKLGIYLEYLLYHRDHVFLVARDREMLKCLVSLDVIVAGYRRCKGLPSVYRTGAAVYQRSSGAPQAVGNQGVRRSVGCPF